MSAVPFLPHVVPGTAPLLTPRQRQQLLGIATRLRVPARLVLYREETEATSIFIVAGGVVKTFRDLPSGRRWVTAFLFRNDLFGLAEKGVYVRTAQAITPVTLYRIKYDALTDMLRRDPELEFQFLCKVTHELREAQRQTIVVGRKDAPGRLAMFIQELEEHTRRPNDGGRSVIDMPMSRSDTASYLGLSLESVSRATRALERQGIVKFIDRHRLRILNHTKFDRLVSAL
jgi:CRP/FNR family transcriptional regulator